MLQKLSNELGVKCVETSAKDAKNVDAAFYALLDAVLEKRYDSPASNYSNVTSERDGSVAPSTAQPINLGKTQKVEKGCQC